MADPAHIDAVIAEIDKREAVGSQTIRCSFSELSEVEQDEVRSTIHELIDIILTTKPDFWTPTHKHLKTGGHYQVLMTGFLERNMTAVTIYRNESGMVFVRPVEEFNDGRFEVLSESRRA